MSTAALAQDTGNPPAIRWEDLQDWKACGPSDLEVFSAEETDDWGVKIFAARLLGNLPVKYLRLRVILEE